jgi:hypothetical protein
MISRSPRTSNSRPKRERRAARPAFGDRTLARLTDAELLKMRFADLPIRIDGTPLEDRIQRMHDELQLKGLRFRPHFWLSTDWFSPDGIPGVAIPFYLAHPRLMQLEESQMLEVEGGTEETCLRILRHEVGHAIDNAYRLRRRVTWKRVFGSPSQPYPEFYTPRPFSKSYVHHLQAWYAQSHPAEDFAETFAVWLKPRSDWRTRYEGWPALKKLKYVDGLMREIRTQAPKQRTRVRVEPLRSIRKTLQEHYQERRGFYGIDLPRNLDRDLLRLFVRGEAAANNGRSAAAFLRRVRARIREDVADWTGEYQYTIDEVLRDMIDRCEVLALRLDKPDQDAERQVLIVLTMHVMNYLNAGYHRIAL